MLAIICLRTGGRHNRQECGHRIDIYDGTAKLPKRYRRRCKPTNPFKEGEDNPNAKLTNEQRQQAIRIRIEQAISHAKIAKIMGVSTNCIRQLLLKAMVA